MVLVFVGACGGVEPTVEAESTSNAVSAEVVANPSQGRYVGTTSQGWSLTLWVEESEDGLVVSQVQYKIEMRAEGFSVTTELNTPGSRQMAIDGGYFTGSHSMGNNTELFSGRFVGEGTVIGDLICTNTHPQGLGTATGEVTFEAFLLAP